jgi:phosphoribosylglycinamide formyltransferase-1
MTARLAVLASGRGSNLQALLDAIASDGLDARVVGVFSDRLAAHALERVPADLRWSRDAKAYARRSDFDAELADAIDAVQPDWIVCAGYLRLLDAAFVARFRGRLLNIHPSLLPAYRGLKTHARAIADGAAEHGASVHFVTPELDAGAVIAQAAVPVHPDDTPDALAERVLAVEHPLLVAVVRLAAAGRLSEHDDAAWLDGHRLLRPLRLESAQLPVPPLPTPR